MIGSFAAALRAIVIALLFDLWPALKILFAFVVARFRACFGRKKKRRIRKRASCVSINHPAFVRPDPMIYDQYYLMGQGKPVVWQNPDIQILQNGSPVVSAYDLQPSMTYIIRATIYNASTSGIVYNMPVSFSYLSFGVGTQSNPIPGPVRTVTLGVKGTPAGVGAVEMPWTTPAVPGHYCVQVSFEYFDDANPFNNLGQENTQVVQAASPASFTFQLRNTARDRRLFRFEVDTFQIVPPPPCSEVAPTRGAPPQTELRAGSGLILAREARAQYPLPDGWMIDLSPADPVLGPDQEISINGTITPADTFNGTQPVNIHAFSGNALVGGITVIVNRA